MARQKQTFNYIQTQISTCGLSFQKIATCSAQTFSFACSLLPHRKSHIPEWQFKLNNCKRIKCKTARKQASKLQEWTIPVVSVINNNQLLLHWDYIRIIIIIIFYTAQTAS